MICAGICIFIFKFRTSQGSTFGVILIYLMLINPGMDATSDVISQYVKVVESDGSDSCPVCLGAPEPLTVELTRCRHRLHLACLNAMLSCQQPPMYIQCPVCRMIYGEKRGNQPPGMMNWTRIPRALSGFPNTNTIQITYE